MADGGGLRVLRPGKTPEVVFDENSQVKTKFSSLQVSLGTCPVVGPAGETQAEVLLRVHEVEANFERGPMFSTQVERILGRAWGPHLSFSAYVLNVQGLGWGGVDGLTDALPPHREFPGTLILTKLGADDNFRLNVGRSTSAGPVVGVTKSGTEVLGKVLFAEADCTVVSWQEEWINEIMTLPEASRIEFVWKHMAKYSVEKLRVPLGIQHGACFMFDVVAYIDVYEQAIASVLKKEDQADYFISIVDAVASLGWAEKARQLVYEMCGNTRMGKSYGVAMTSVAGPSDFDELDIMTVVTTVVLPDLPKPEDLPRTTANRIKLPGLGLASRLGLEVSRPSVVIRRR